MRKFNIQKAIQIYKRFGESGLRKEYSELSEEEIRVLIRIIRRRLAELAFQALLNTIALSETRSVSSDEFDLHI